MPGTFEKVCQMAQSMNNAGLRRSLRPVLANKKRGGALAAPPEERKTTRVGKSRYSSFTSSYRFFLTDAIFARRRLHVCSKLHNFEISRGSRRAVRRYGN